MESTIRTEKYRPDNFEAVKGQKEIVRTISAMVGKKNLPHLLFAGPPGCGKTTLSIIVAKKLFGEEWKRNFLELNASDDRGIDVVRNTIKDFARTKAIGDYPFKIIYLDECLGYNSNILLNLGGRITKLKIGDFVENYECKDAKALSIDDNGKMAFADVTGVMKIPHRREEGFYKVKVHNTELELTGNHLLVTRDGWKQVRELRAGDKVLCPLSKSAAFSSSSAQFVGYELTSLPREIKKKERYITNSPEKAVLELLASQTQGLNRTEITSLSGIASPKLTSILSDKNNEPYLSLVHHNILKKKGDKFVLNCEKHKAINKLYALKREQNKNNIPYVTESLSSKALYPLRKDKALVIARLMGHLFSDGCLSLKTKQLIYSGKEEDLNQIKRDINSLGFNILGHIRHNRWKNGECWSFGAYKIDLLSLFYSLGAPVGKKTDNYYLLPDWIMYGDWEIKREFLAAFFGGEGSKPKFQGRNIKPILFAQAKRKDLKENLAQYLNQMKELLSEFDVDCNIKIIDKIKSIRTDNTETIEGKLWIKNSMGNIIRFLEEIGYRYCTYKEKEAE